MLVPEKENPEKHENAFQLNSINEQTIFYASTIESCVYRVSFSPVIQVLTEHQDETEEKKRTKRMAEICTITSNLLKIKLVLAKRVFLRLEIIFGKQFIQFHLV